MVVGSATCNEEIECRFVHAENQKSKLIALLSSGWGEGGREVMLDGRQIVDVSTTDVELHFE